MKTLEINKEFGNAEEALEELGYVEVGSRIINKVNGNEIENAIYNITPEEEIDSIDNFIETTIYQKDNKEFAYLNMEHFNTYIYNITLLELK